MVSSWELSLFSFLLGLVLGSFMNVCIHRIPLGRSIVSPPSACPECGERIRFYDNIPLISYLLLAGKCRYCRHRISWRYPAVEALSGLMSIALFTRYGPSYQYLIFLAFTMMLVVISFIDLDHRIIPDVLSLSGILAGLAASFLPGGVNWLESLIGIVSGGGILLLVAYAYSLLTGREGLGGGDIKLLAMIGAWLGWKGLPFVVLMSSTVGAAVGFAFILLSGKGFRFRIPFGPFLSLGALLYLFFGPQVTEWYFGLFV